MSDPITWYLAQYKPNCHRIAERNLMRQGFATFLPMQEETSRARGRFTTRPRPLFPGYLLVALDVLKGGWRAVHSTYGITRLVSLGREPTPVPRDLVTALMARCDGDGILQAPELGGTQDAALRPGDHVRLMQGPFADFVARIDSIAPDRRVWVLMEIMGAQTRVAIPAAHLRPV